MIFKEQFLLLGVLFAVLWGTIVYACYLRYDEEYIDLYCNNGRITLDHFYYRAGSLRFRPNLSKNCSFTIVASARSFSSKAVAIYFNVRRQNLRRFDEVNIYEVTASAGSGHTEILVKSLKGSRQFAHLDPLSYNQLISQYSKNPQLFFRLELGPGQNRSSEFLQIDWTIIREDSTRKESFCRALEGYISDELKCENEDLDRVNCPDSYSPSVDLNHVYGRDHLPDSDQVCRALATPGTLSKFHLPFMLADLH